MRFFISAVVGIVVTLLLFFFMDSLISMSEKDRPNVEGGQMVDFIRVRPDEIENIKKRAPPPKPPPPKDPPPPPKLSISKAEAPQQQNLNIETPDISLGVSTGDGPFIGTFNPGDPAAEGDVIPIVRINPIYPRDALLNGISGWVRLSFMINADGTVSQPAVIDSNPKRIFNRNAIRALLKWKFKPRIIDGVAVARPGEVTIEFDLDSS